MKARTVPTPNVESDRRLLQDRVGMADRVFLLHPAQAVDDGLVADADRFGVPVEPEVNRTYAGCAGSSGVRRSWSSTTASERGRRAGRPVRTACRRIPVAAVLPWRPWR